MSAGHDALGELAERLEGVAEELADMAIDALSRATAGDPDSAETGEALADEKRILKARRGIERAITALTETSGARRRGDFGDGAD